MFALGDMVATLAVFSVVRALTIDSQLTLIRNDCYERMAIGQRLSPKDIYKTPVNINTVQECQYECSKDKDLCKSFSFGVGVKGNATCELSTDPVKETADLKPIGTRTDTDFDLYIKKLGCTLVLDKNNPKPNKPQSDNTGYNSPKPPIKPVNDDYNPSPVHDEPPNYGSSPSTLRPIYDKPSASQGDELHHVQTLGPYNYARPPYRPPQYDSSNAEEEPYGPKPIPDKYGSYIPRPEDYYYRPKPSGDYDRPNHRPNLDYDRPDLKPIPAYDRPDHRPNPAYDRPDPRPHLDYDRPDHRPNPDYDRPDHRPNPVYDRPGHRPNLEYDRPDLKPKPDYERPNLVNDYDRPNPVNNYDKPKPDSGYSYPRPKPENYVQNPVQEYDQKPSNSGYNQPMKPDNNGYDERPKPNYEQKPKPSQGNDYLFNQDLDRYDTKPKPPGDGYGRPMVTQSIGPHGQAITSIITELDGACFRRVLAGKRVARGLVKRALFCERVEDCQVECAEEKRFACEGFNYRLDPAGRGKGECELLDIPLSHLDIGRDLYPDPDYDYYERDRNAASANCRRRPPPPRYPGTYEGDFFHDQSGYNRWDDRQGSRRPRPRPYDYDDGYGDNRRGDFAYHHQSSSSSHHSSFEQSNYHHYEGGQHYLPPRPHHPPPPYDYQSYEPFLPPNRRPPYINKFYVDDDRDKDYWGLRKPTYGGSYGTSYNPQEFNRRNYYLPPPKSGGTKDWGQYGGSYGNGGFDLQYSGYGQNSAFWGLNKHEDNYQHKPQKPPPPVYLPVPELKPPLGGGSYLPERPPATGGYLPERPQGGSYLPERPQGGSYLPERPQGGGYLPERPQGGSYLPERPQGASYLPERPYGGGFLPIPSRPNFDNDYMNAILPAEPRFPPRYDFLKEECSLRSATGFRLNKGIVKKFFAVPSIYECEQLCFKERDFPCASYAFRYTISLTAPTDNCYLSNRNYKELDYYTDLQPDRDFDIYTMNNQNRCEQPIIRGKDNSDCFWRVRSGQRLEHRVVRDSLTVKSIVDCQIECLRSVRFTCRAFSFRYGSPIIGGAIDNCQLTDWPFFELDPRSHFIPEPGFELYERGSFGHGCEPDHFGIRGKPWKQPPNKADQLCYIGFGSPARLLPQASRKSLQVPTELDCKKECSRMRDKTLFQCMSFSFSSGTRFKWGDNCILSDILQRDLLPNIDYVADTDSWLFAWDNYNPECVALVDRTSHNQIENRRDFGPIYALDTWRMYSVSGWPCRRGSRCQENREAGFWFCELEGGDANTWDYCCRPDHQCGFSQGFPYQWCYVGPARSQWRKCSERYYPYIDKFLDKVDSIPPPWAGGSGNYEHGPPPFRPDRPPAPPTRPPPRPSLDEYETLFDNQFLEPPRPGGFGQPRHWPLSYLHKEMPPNNTDSESRLMKAARGSDPNPKFAAIQNLIDVIKSNDLKNVQYQISNESNKEDDILFVRIPLPTNFTQESRKSEKMTMEQSTVAISGPVDLKDAAKNNTKRSHKALPLQQERFIPVYRKSYITRTNVTTHNSSRYRSF